MSELLVSVNPGSWLAKGAKITHELYQKGKTNTKTMQTKKTNREREADSLPPALIQQPDQVSRISLTTRLHLPGFCRGLPRKGPHNPQTFWILSALHENITDFRSVH